MVAKEWLSQGFPLYSIDDFGVAYDIAYYITCIEFDQICCQINNNLM